MKKTTLLLIGLLTILMVNAQNKETRNLDSFDKINVGEAINLIIEKGNEEKALVEVDGVDLEDVITEVRGSTLKINMAPGNFRSSSVTVYLTYKEINSIRAGSAAKVESKSILKGETFKVQVGSAAKVELEVDVDDLDVDVDSAGKLELAGKSNTINIDVNSAGKLYAFDLDSKRVNADVNSAGKAEITVGDELIAEANSGGSLSYKGNPERVISDSNSGGRVRKY